MAVFPSTVVRSSFNVSVSPNETDLLSGAEGLSLKEKISKPYGHEKRRSQAHLSLEPPPTPAPLLEIDTEASSKLQEEAADTIVAPESRREETKLYRTLIVAELEK